MQRNKQKKELLNSHGSLMGWPSASQAEDRGFVPGPALWNFFSAKENVKVPAYICKQFSNMSEIPIRTMSHVTTAIQDLPLREEACVSVGCI